MDGLVVEARERVYALGVVLYEVLTGSRRHGHDDDRTGGATSPSGPSFHPLCPPEVSAALDTLVARCLQKRQANRFASMADLAGALRAARAPVAPPRRAACEDRGRRGRRVRATWASAALRRRRGRPRSLRPRRAHRGCLSRPRLRPAAQSPALRRRPHSRRRFASAGRGRAGSQHSRTEAPGRGARPRPRVTTPRRPSAPPRAAAARKKPHVDEDHDLLTRIVTASWPASARSSRAKGGVRRLGEHRIDDLAKRASTCGATRAAADLRVLKGAPQVTDSLAFDGADPRDALVGNDASDQMSTRCRRSRCPRSARCHVERRADDCNRSS